MKDRLDDFITGNKKQFDEFEVPAGLWARIEEQLDAEKAQPVVKQPKVIKISQLIRIAAVVLVVLTAGIFFWKNNYTKTPDIASIDPQLAKKEMHYASLIEIKRSELKRIEKEEPQ